MTTRRKTKPRKLSPNQALALEVTTLQARLSVALGDATKARGEAERLRKHVDGLGTSLQARRKDIERLKEDLLAAKLSEARLMGRLQEADAARAERSEVVMVNEDTGPPSLVCAGTETDRHMISPRWGTAPPPKHWVNL